MKTEITISPKTTSYGKDILRFQLTELLSFMIEQHLIVESTNAFKMRTAFQTNIHTIASNLGILTDNIYNKDKQRAELGLYKRIHDTIYPMYKYNIV